MMKADRLACAFAAILGFATSTHGQSVAPDAEGFIAAPPEKLVPAEGARSVAILGDSTQPGLYVVRITFQPGQGSRPHFHDQARYITVIKGTWYVALGAAADVYDPDQMTPMKPGSFIYQPPNGHHYDMAKDEEVTVQIIGTGPVKTTQIPQSEPARGPARP
jgi:quercetin dioxygenase-like cupin family protein